MDFENIEGLIVKLKQAMGSGARVVEYEGKRIEWDSAEGLLKRIRYFESLINKGGIKTQKIKFSKGL